MGGTERPGLGKMDREGSEYNRPLAEGPRGWPRAMNGVWMPSRMRRVLESGTRPG